MQKQDQFSRERLLFGDKAIEKLHNSKVAIFGLGGVGSYVVEALVRAGVENFIIIDDDRVCLTNLNRQIIATRKTIGKFKTDAEEERILSINPNAKVTKINKFFMPDTDKDFLNNEKIDYIVDCIDTVTGKIEIVKYAKEKNIPIISAMGSANKLDPTKFEVADISKTSVCPLAKAMRKLLRKNGIYHLKVVYSKEDPLIPDQSASCKNHCICPPGTKRKCSAKNQIPGSTSFVPPVVGMIIGGEVIKDICINEINEFQESMKIEN